MTPAQVMYPRIDTTNMRWHEAVDAADHAITYAHAIREYATQQVPPRRGWIARLEWVARVNGLRAAAHLLDEHATAYTLHARTIEQEAK